MQEPERGHESGSVRGQLDRGLGGTGVRGDMREGGCKSLRWDRSLGDIIMAEGRILEGDQGGNRIDETGDWEVIIAWQEQGPGRGQE